MTVMIWKNVYSVGVVSLDNDHKKLIAMINELYFAMQNDSAQKVVNSIIGEMLLYAKEHMSQEEDYMREANYLGLLEHRREHETFIAKALELKQRSEEEGFVLSLEVIMYLTDWLNDHILETDMKYIDAFKAKGIC